MSREWKQFQDELNRRGKGLQWLADRMNCSVQRVQNWTTRGVPKGAYPDLAAAFEESIDWVAGLAPPKHQQEHTEPLDEDAKALLAEYLHMKPDQRQALRKLAEVAKLVPPPEPPQLKRDDYLGPDTNWGDDLAHTGE